MHEGIYNRAKPHRYLDQWIGAKIAVWSIAAR